MIASERPKEALIDFSKNYNEKFKYVPSLRSIWEEENERRKNLNQEEIYTIKKTIRDPVNPHEWCCTNRYQEMLDDALKKFKHEKLNFNSIFREYENNEVRTAFQANMKYNGEKKLLYSLVSLPEEPVSLDNIVLISSNSNEGQSSKSYSDDISSSLKKSLNLSSRNDSNCNAEQTYRKEENLEDELNEEDIYGAYDFLDAYDEINNDNDDNDNNDDNNNDNQINYIKDEEEIDPNEFSILNDEFISLSSPNILNNNNSNNSNNNNNRHQNNKNSISESNYFIPQFDGADDSYIIIDDDDSDVNISKNDIEKPKNNNKHINKRKYNIIDTKSDNEKVKIFKGINSKILQYNKEINKSKNQIINSKSPPKLNCKINKNKHYNSKENIIEILSDDTIISETDESLIKSDDEIQRKKLIKRRMKKLPNDKESSNNNIKINEVKQLSIEIESSGIGDKNSSHDNHSSENIITKSLSNTEKLLRNSDTETQQSKIIKNDDVTIEEFDSFFISPTLLSISSFSPKLKSPTINNTDNDNNLNKEDEVSKNEKSPKKEEILTIKSNDVSTKSYFYKFYVCPPSKNILLNTMSLYNIPETVYQEPFFSNDKDAKDVIILDGYKKILSERESNQEFYTNDCMINDYLNLNQSKEKIKGIDYWKNIQYYKEIINDLNKHKFITPLQKPPSKKYLLNKNKKENSAKIINSVNERIKEDIKEKYKWKPYKYYISQLNMELFGIA
ncbi:hypothetical protein BCR36DRAFT_98735 [Piromyces finnis]|uniref:Uncharacterized protein n=1 Tax=Piromyces finnis TaxID=1754191 RepID=A0A1Y1V4A8_9FUNG|nr:hypothetical protein BCR36DRAFT_98735 [Piromyces finnis]|eukprot:ORX46866.1 hypothetical protein BCR36DRAFT_98735 [Piromyces finnis]